MIALDSWQDLLLQSVSPLSEGVSPLKVYGWKSPEHEEARPRRTAAVLVAIAPGENPSVVLTRRSEHLQHHPGQVSFPGGARDENDDTGVLTALREAEEEIGLRGDNIKPIGFLDRVDTISDFRVLPVVGLIHREQEFIPDQNEVDMVFTLPLAHALDVKAWQQLRVRRHGQEHVLYSMDWEGNTIWGVTAAILRNLARRVERFQANQ